MGVKIQTIKDIRFYLASELEGILPAEEIRAISNIIIRKTLGIKQQHQAYISEQPVSSSQAADITEICLELKTGKPVQYIVGETIFYDCIIHLNGATLIPRPETEELVDMIIRENRDFTGKIIDFGTGSGCIAIALAANLPGADVTATDISEEALKMAAENAELNNVNITFIKDDILKPEISLYHNTGIIVSNPPYVRNSEKKLMNRNVIDFEPHTALFVTDEDPLAFYKAILNSSLITLSTGGKIYFEINEAMGKPVIQLLESYGYGSVKTVQDINGKERIVKGIKNGRQ